MRVEQATEKVALREWKLDEGIRFPDPNLTLDPVRQRRSLERSGAGS
jgi:hypothetical protein